MGMTILAVLAAGVMAAGAGEAQAPSESAALRQEVAELRRSVNDLVGLVRTFVEQAAARDRADLVLRRLTLEQARLGALEAERREIEARGAEARRELQQATDAVLEADRIAQMQMNEASALALRAEREQSQARQHRAGQELADLDRRADAIDAELTRRREVVRGFEIELDVLLPPAR